MAKITEGDYIYDTAFTMFEEAKKYCLEAKKYQKAGYYQKALEEYDSTLFWLESFFSLSERNNSVSLSLKTEIFFLFFVVNIVGRIRNCYIELKEPYKLSVFLKIFEEIVETIGKHEKDLSAEEFIIYQKLKKEIELDPDDIEFAEAKAILQKGYQDIIDNSDDPTFIGLVSKYEKCCSYENFLVPSKEVSISSYNSSISDNKQSSVQMSHVVAAILFPPLGVFLTVGLGIHFWINLVLTLVFTWIPGMIHAVWLVYNHDRS